MIGGWRMADGQRRLDLVKVLLCLSERSGMSEGGTDAAGRLGDGLVCSAELLDGAADEPRDSGDPVLDALNDADVPVEHAVQFKDEGAPRKTLQV